ncbi:hypothetical protein [Prevotella jejuni]
MRTSKINIGTKVLNKKNQEGTITKVITKSTGYVEVTYLNGIIKKEMAFNLFDENGESLKATPKAKKHVLTIAERIQNTKEFLLRSLLPCEREQHDATVSALEKSLKENSNDFINSLTTSYVNHRLSEKQAFYLAKYMIENNL